MPAFARPGYTVIIFSIFMSMKTYRIIGHISFLVLLVLSVVFFTERTTFIDPAKQVFDMVNKGSFVVFLQRHSQVVSQVLPYIGIQLHADLRTIMLLYSMSFILVYYLCFVLSAHTLRNLPAAMALVAVPLMVRHTFVHSISETWLAIGYCSLFYAWINYTPPLKNPVFRNILTLLVGIILILLNYFLHPVTLFLLGFAMGYTFIDQQKWTSPGFYLLGVSIIMIFGYRFLFPATAYEDGFFTELKNFRAYLPDFFRLPSFLFAKEQFRTIYIFPFLLAVLLLVHYIRHRKFLRLAFLLLYVLVYEFILVIAFHRNDGPMYYETRYIPFIFFLMIPLFREVIPSLRIHRNRLVQIYLGIILVIGFVMISRTMQQHYSPRVKYYRQLTEDLRNRNGNKFVAGPGTISTERLFSWGVSIESLLVSSMDGPQHSMTIYADEHPEKIDPGVFDGTNCAFLHTSWWVLYPMQKLNKRYFGLDCAPYLLLQPPIGRSQP